MDLSIKMTRLATKSLRRSREHRKDRDGEVAKLREKLEKERASLIEAAARFEEELNKFRVLGLGYRFFMSSSFPRDSLVTCQLDIMNKLALQLGRAFDGVAAR